MKDFYDRKLHTSWHRPQDLTQVPDRYDLIAARCRELASPSSHLSIIEIGPETPEAARFIIEALRVSKDNYHAVDLSAASTKVLESAGFDCRLADVSRDPLPFSADFAEIVIMSEVVEHLTDPDFALEEVRRVLVPGGLLVITTPNLASWFNRLLLLLGIQPLFTETGTEWNLGREPLMPATRPVGHLRVLTSRALAELLEIHGYQIVEARGLSLPNNLKVPGWVRRLDHLMTRFRTVSAGALVISRKGNSKKVHLTPPS